MKKIKYIMRNEINKLVKNNLGIILSNKGCKKS